ncbi:MAG: ribosomal L7Ae/L30e/S12e/Gadd45 family protein [Anaeromicrobium sp.]|jgi:ribosomal protein L7Ae-like RNA K-turn-binding protein|uniref:L7Ae/L30e/S12e/Gadd45 family ribosomal protein n=1 Tax=Anaeromicrobium sp. TaxID=1929132 RepID=UPI0025F61B97|nr:ribosomal L7Ae/L30e/S12e/Gadd45 family protein [Anaeromicrobium sp.]MCT4595627.1 ribosomal L7Ae/L30e/S12e/Gadd45 family protein [Anaeromicrobium sp.]
MKNKIYSMLGLAQRSGNLMTGEDTCLMDIKKGKINLVIVADDASENTKKKFKDACAYRNIKFLVYGEREELSHAIGKYNRAVYAVRDKGFSEKICSLIETN